MSTYKHIWNINIYIIISTPSSNKTHTHGSTSKVAKMMKNNQTCNAKEQLKHEFKPIYYLLQLNIFSYITEVHLKLYK